MKTIKVLNDYLLELFADAATGVSGSIWHIAFFDHGAGGVHTPVGYFLGGLIQPSELRPLHWDLQLFLRSDIRYDERQQQTHVGRSTLSHLPRFHRLLPEETANALTQATCCKEPISVTVSILEHFSCNQIGNTWIEDD